MAVRAAPLARPNACTNSRIHHISARTEKSGGLTLAELGQFLGLSESGVSKYENLARDPGRDTLIAAELVFGVPARKLFPGLYAPIEREMLARVAALAEALQDDGSKEAAAKRELLEQIAVRLAGEQTSI